MTHAATGIVCATDLSPESDAVVRVAAALARRLRVPLDLFHVVHVPPALPLDLFDKTLIGDLRVVAETKIEAQAAELRASGIATTTSVHLGFIDDSIAHHAAKTRAELLVIGTHARGGAARAFMGSVAERTIRGAPCPTLVVPPEPISRLARGKPFSGPLKLTVAIDLSLASDSALSWLQAFGQRLPCDLRLVHLYWPPREHELLGFGPAVAFEDEPEVVEVLSRGLRAHILAELGRDDLPLRVRPFWGDDESPLAWEAEMDDADLLVVGTSRGGSGRGATSPGGASRGRSSTVIAAVRGSRVPVLCIPARPAPARKPALAPIRTVLVTTDFSTLGDAAIPEAYRLLARGGGEVVLASIVEGSAIVDPERQNQTEAALRGLVPPRAGSQAIRTRTFVTGGPSAGEAIVKAIRRFNPDVVVMASHGRSGIARGIHGSVTEHVARRSPKPLLVVPAPAA
jgi:nucleotide-binding universal stress UspA family protein